MAKNLRTLMLTKTDPAAGPCPSGLVYLFTTADGPGLVNPVGTKGSKRGFLVKFRTVCSPTAVLFVLWSTGAQLSLRNFECVAIRTRDGYIW